MKKLGAKILPRQEKFRLKHYKLNLNEPAQCPDERKVVQHHAYQSPLNVRCKLPSHVRLEAARSTLFPHEF